MTVYQIVEKMYIKDARGLEVSYEHPINDRLFSTYDKAKDNILEDRKEGSQYNIKSIVVE